jgi:hypothetical protein
LFEEKKVKGIFTPFISIKNAQFIAAHDENVNGGKFIFNE